MVDVTEHRDSVAWAQLRASAVVVLAVTVLGAVLALALSLTRAPQYASTVTLITQVTGSSSDSETQVRTVQALVTSSTLADDLATNTDAGSSRAIQNAISVARPPGSAVLNVTVIDSSRVVSRRIAEAIAPAISTRLNDLNNLPQVTKRGASYSVEPFGQLTTRKVRAAAWRNAAVAAVLSLLVALSVAVFRAQRRPVVADAASAAGAFGSPVLATVPFLARATHPWNAVDAVGGMLSPGVAAAWPADLAHVLVVGSSGSAGADLVIMLGQTFASHGRRVLLVDADLARGRLSRRLGLRKSPGLADVIAGAADAESVVQVVAEGSVPRGLYALSEEATQRLSVLPAGTIEDVRALAAPEVEEM